MERDSEDRHLEARVARETTIIISRDRAIPMLMHCHNTQVVVSIHSLLLLSRQTAANHPIFHQFSHFNRPSNLFRIHNN
jgi:hypothetical protein